MKLLQQFNEITAAKKLNEEGDCGGAVGSGAVSGFAMPLFSKLAARSTPKVRVIKWGKTKAPQGNIKSKKRGLGLKEAFVALTEFGSGGSDTGAMSMNMDGTPAAQGKSSFDATATIAKLKGLEDKEKQNYNNTVSFGLEDENGGLVRVSVSAEQSEEFEKALQAFLARGEQDGEGVPEIAEVLFKLKDQFDIVDVQWPEVQEDEEEDVSLQGEEGGEPGQDIDLGDQPDADQPDPTMDAAGGADEGQVKDLLTQVIDMMKADAEARKAEARAREAEAKGKEADAIVKQVTSKVKQEEQFLDMEKYEKAQKEEEREVKRLAKLARWKHEMGGDDDDLETDEPEQQDTSDLDAMLNQPKQSKPAPAAAPREEEESTTRRPAPVVAQKPQKSTTIRGRVHPHDIASFILSRVK